MTGSNSSQPKWRRFMNASSLKTSRITTAAGMPSVSKLIPSCIQHDVHEPQAPTPMTMKSTCAFSSSYMSCGTRAEEVGLAHQDDPPDSVPLLQELANAFEHDVARRDTVVK